MQISGICYIANKFKSKEKDYQNSGTVGHGTLTWSDKMKTPKTKEEYKSYTHKPFVCFGANVDMMYSCRENLLHIEGYLKTEFYKDRDGKDCKTEKVYISKVMLAEQSNNATPKQAYRAKAVKEEDDNFNYFG